MNKFYENLSIEIQELLEKDTDIIANLANVSACINYYLADINWVGFYILKEGQLVLAPFQGKPACTRIAIGDGVCGKAVADCKIMRIDNVHLFDGHIACDCDSNSEIVLPIYKNNAPYGVLDIDSPKFARFTQDDEDGLAKIADLISKFLMGATD
ncbi:MAG: GAF domain-containing protein [Defluviitaleaceae bacterium]|nr:GAF domain-containing protein [Defluviitaleaceae bacterium]